eukprot:GFUD01127157.1.p1 GENE.GFUD01127157.1~~GFUD01127157.1.p1  ORF type:complete len:168 (-),score=31.90 GFUD01127157.1:299-802(-)
MLGSRLISSGLKLGLSNQKLLLSPVKFCPSGISLAFKFCSTKVDEHTYLYLTNETLESINDKFSEIIEDHEKLSGGDTTLADGVLTVKLAEFGTYVVNKQTPNMQIWLSSPVSGPARYDLQSSGEDLGCWVYKHTGETLHSLLDREMGELVGEDTDFQECFMGGRGK